MRCVPAGWCHASARRRRPSAAGPSQVQLLSCGSCIALQPPRPGRRSALDMLCGATWMDVCVPVSSR
jgi:hypothetical protein